MAMSKPDTFLGLLHHPVLDREGKVIATAVTNVDLHDIARSSKTYDLAGLYFVTPIASQQLLVSEIVRHWTDGSGATRNPVRARAFALAQVSASLDEAIEDIRKRTGQEPELVVTSAQVGEEMTTFLEYREELRSGDLGPQLLLFGTGWGMAPAVMERATRRLVPVRIADWARTEVEGPHYNHLSVRSAVATVLDRLFGHLD